MFNTANLNCSVLKTPIYLFILLCLEFKCSDIQQWFYTLLTSDYTNNFVHEAYFLSNWFSRFFFLHFSTIVNCTYCSKKMRSIHGLPIIIRSPTTNTNVSIHKIGQISYYFTDWSTCILYQVTKVNSSSYQQWFLLCQMNMICP